LAYLLVTSFGKVSGCYLIVFVETKTLCERSVYEKIGYSSILICILKIKCFDI